METRNFDCSLCPSEDIQVESSPSECQTCHQLKCKSCIDESGVCVPCE